MLVQHLQHWTKEAVAKFYTFASQDDAFRIEQVDDVSQPNTKHMTGLLKSLAGNRIVGSAVEQLLECGFFLLVSTSFQQRCVCC